MIGKTNVSNSGSGYSYIQAEYPENLSCYCTRTSDKRVVRAKDKSGTNLFALPKMKNTPQLPVEYQEVEYIESNGTQFLNTGYTDTTGLRIQAKISPTSFSNGNVFFAKQQIGAQYTDGVSMYTESDGYLCFSIGGNDFYKSSLLMSAGTDYVIDYNSLSSSVYIDINGSRIYSQQNATIVYNPYPLFLFCANNGGTPQFFGSLKLYYFKIYNNYGELVRDMRPCYRRSDNVAGLYDTVDSEFIPNHGTGSFVVGADINIDEWTVTCEGNNFISTKKIIIYMNGQYEQVSLIIPNGYKKVEYIQSSAAQSIDIGVPARDLLKVLVNFQVMSTSPQVGVIIGGDSSQENNALYLGTNYDTNYKSYFVYYNGNVHDVTNVLDSDQHYVTISLANGMQFLTKDGTSAILGTQSLSGATVSQTLHIFSDAAGGTKSSARIYGCKIYDILNNSIMIRNLIPVYRINDSKAGLWDTVGKTFYPNLTTTALLLGPEIE